MNTETTPTQDYERKILRQLKLINIFMGFFTLMFIGLITGAVVVGITVVTFVNHTQKQINNFEKTTTENLDLKQKICSGNDELSQFVKSNTQTCQ